MMRTVLQYRCNIALSDNSQAESSAANLIHLCSSCSGGDRFFRMQSCSIDNAQAISSVANLIHLRSFCSGGDRWFTTTPSF